MHKKKSVEQCKQYVFFDDKQTDLNLQCIAYNDDIYVNTV